jgi:hypothetical protein
MCDDLFPYSLLLFGIQSPRGIEEKLFNVESRSLFPSRRLDDEW